MSSTSVRDGKILYQPYSSILNPGFWHQLANIKLNQLRLSKDPVEIHGSYSCNLSSTLPCLASFDHNSFSSNTHLSDRSSCPLYGKLICTNIMQEFIDFNKKELLDSLGDEVWKSVQDGRALEDPERFLSKVGLLVYADLKKYKFFYWFTFPALNYPKDAYLELGKTPGETIGSILDFFSEETLQVLQDEYDKPANQRDFQRGYFIVRHYIDIVTGVDKISVFPLSLYQTALQHEDNMKDVNIYFAYTDPSSSLIYPGWPLRNYLCLIAVQFQLDRVKIIRLRKGQPSSKSKIELHHSMVLELTYKLDAQNNHETEMANVPKIPLITGWEKNESQHMAPKIVNLSNLLDPKRLAENSVNLNLRLMKWRLLPTLDLDKIAETKCLILGCGTLGCHILRGLLAWGVKDVSLVDNAKISYSNPVRQTLYNFEDCTKPGGAYKSIAAANSLKKIHPSVNVDAHVLSIPMPGHHISEKEIEQTKKDVSLLENLIDAHDAVFLLMDTRESRWLPTVIAMSKQKLVINAAIGFDTFLLQRYGIRDYSLNQQPTSSFTSSIPSHRRQSDQVRNDSSCRSSTHNQLSSDKLGCYFCNDIVAPGDSTLDRTLDQQCTVSRPGVSMMVSAMAVELLASIMSSRLGVNTPAPLEIATDQSIYNDDDFECDLGIVPHSIRGNISRFYTYIPTTPAFNKCSACSPAVINAYRTSGFEFLHQVFQDPNYLEEIAGLKDLQNVSDTVWALDSDEDTDHLDCLDSSNKDAD